MRIQDILLTVTMIEAPRMKSLLTSSLVLIWGAQLEGHCSRLVVSTMVAHDNHLGKLNTMEMPNPLTLRILNKTSELS